MNVVRAIKPTPGEEALRRALDSLGERGVLAAEAVRLNGLPNRRVEQWRWSDLRAAVDAQTPIVNAHDLSHAALANDGAAKSIISNLAAALSSNDINEFDLDGLHERTGQANRNITVKNGHKVLIERISAEPGLSAGSFRALVEGGALTRVVIQDGVADSIMLNHADVTVAPGGRYEQFVLSFGGKLTRIETQVSLWDGGELVLNAAYLTGPGRHSDITSVVTAEGPDHEGALITGANCKQIIKGAVRAGGRGVFQGKILVQRAAQKTDARQYHQALLLEEGAEIYAKPELQIYADDVQCAHGNTVGALDNDALFYLRSRGVPEAEARAILIEAFLSEAIPASLEGAIRQEILDRMHQWLEAR